MRVASAYYKSELGVLKVTGTEDGIHAVEFTNIETTAQMAAPTCLRECFRQLDEYFSGGRQQFALPLKPQGTDFQKAVWNELSKIPYGQTVTYMHVAKALGNPNAVRAVGAANGRNPIPIIVPCHRVIGSNGDLIGFGGGIWRKEFLLRHEKVVLI